MTETTPIRVALIDDHTVVRSGLGPILTRTDIAYSYADLPTFVAERPEVELVLFDLNLSGTGRPGIIQGAAGVRLLREAGYRVLIYTNEHRREVLVTCLAAGANGVVHKSESIEVLEGATERVARGEVVITTALVGLAEMLERQGELPTLSPRQREVLSGRARAEPFQSIAKRLFITDRTAEEHMAAVNQKFADYLRDHSPADLERQLGIAPGDVLDHP